MPAFIKGLALSESFFFEAAKPVLDREFPGLAYTAGLLGYGSDVLGFDDEVSTDHMWGPRFYLFLRDGELSLKSRIMAAFSDGLPRFFRGYSVNFSAPDPNDQGIRHLEPAEAGPVSPLIFIDTPQGYLSGYLGACSFDRLSAADWLSFSEHKLLSLSAGKFFIDRLNMEKLLEPLRFYPEEVRLYLIASNWSLLAEEQAFVRRCADVGDETGSVLACCRIAERLMRLAFLYCGRYAPYSKWFGTAFSKLPIDASIKEALHAAVTAQTIDGRETQLAAAQLLIAGLHNQSGLTGPVDVRIEPYFERNIKVIYADRIAAAVQKQLTGTELERFPLIGTMSEVANFTAFFDNPAYRSHIKTLYESFSSR